MTKGQMRLIEKCINSSKESARCKQVLIHELHAAVARSSEPEEPALPEVEYRVYWNKDGADALAADVTRLMCDGWRIWGGVTFDSKDTAYQTMAREVRRNDE